MHLDFAVNKDCLNLMDSYGEICVKCNCCGRFDESTKLEAQLRTLKKHLQENRDFNDWFEECEEIQRANVAANISYLEEEIRKVEEQIKMSPNPEDHEASIN